MKFTCTDKTLQVSGSGPNGEAVGPISFKSGSYTTEDPNELHVLLMLAPDGVIAPPETAPPEPAAPVQEEEA